MRKLFVVAFLLASSGAWAGTCGGNGCLRDEPTVRDFAGQIDIACNGNGCLKEEPAVSGRTDVACQGSGCLREDPPTDIARPTHVACSGPNCLKDDGQPIVQTRPVDVACTGNGCFKEDADEQTIPGLPTNTPQDCGGCKYPPQPMQLACVGPGC